MWVSPPVPTPSWGLIPPGCAWQVSFCLNLDISGKSTTTQSFTFTHLQKPFSEFWSWLASNIFKPTAVWPDCLHYCISKVQINVDQGRVIYAPLKILNLKFRNWDLWNNSISVWDNAKNKCSCGIVFSSPAQTWSLMFHNGVVIVFLLCIISLLHYFRITVVPQLVWFLVVGTIGFANPLRCNVKYCPRSFGIFSSSNSSRLPSSSLRGRGRVQIGRRLPSGVR